jgi:hypothetical protein
MDPRGKAKEPVRRIILRWCGPMCVVMILCGSTVWLYGDRDWVEEALAFDVEAGGESGSAEDAEEAKRAVEAAMDSGAFGVLLAGRALWIQLRSHALYWIIVLPLLGLCSGKWAGQRFFLCTIAESSPVLGAGILLNAVLRKVCVKINATLSPAFFLRAYDARIFWHEWALEVDLGLLLFLLLVACRGARWFEERPVPVFLLLLGVWASLTLLASMVSSPFDLTF